MFVALFTTQFCAAQLPLASHQIRTHIRVSRFTALAFLTRVQPQAKVPSLVTAAASSLFTTKMPDQTRTLPNIIITGTPGVGKSTLSSDLASRTGLHHLSITDIVKQHSIGTASTDPDDPRTTDLDEAAEDRILDCVENDLEDGGQIIDWHSSEIFPVKMIDLVVVVRCDNTVLYDRLKKRGYGEKKIEGNLDCEIMEECLREAQEAYDEEMIVQLRSEKVEDVDENLDRLEQWVKNWEKHNGGDELEAEGEKKDEDDPMFLHG
ncbi:P-loop containing nucleoside triphosphate hydrolase protein [Polychaeton citri CBS 116435]|uniref:Adenylate kinase isoenzyme 6 homolog n=1 Tax=Polychaeton citri CBS 116435 TaxID=1314669 RepID=A0A9P4Q4Y0_9PEZI|nr:P-loop containing nucleoside triphosphate hydrolase protein [Polychaeton citri CBS 116435]